MNQTFSKYHGNGNDFIIFATTDSIEKVQSYSVEKIQRLCDRHTGIGADGVIFVRSRGAIYEIVVFNCDGSIAKNCGNGLRCIAQEIFSRNERNEVTICFGDRYFNCIRSGQDVEVYMGDCIVEPPNFISALGARVGAVNIANQHTVVCFDNLVENYGPLRKKVVDEMKLAQQETNIGFLFPSKNGHYFSHVYENGVGWTKSCATGACAAACFLVRSELAECAKPIVIQQPGGVVRVNVKERNVADSIMRYSVTQSGAAVHVFSGICGAHLDC